MAAAWALRAAHAVELEGQGDVLHRGEPGEQVEVLEDVADGPAAQARLAVARQGRQGLAADITSPLVGSSRLPAMVSSVLLPEPLAPITATNEPTSTERSMR